MKKLLLSLIGLVLLAACSPTKTLNRQESFPLHQLRLENRGSQDINGLTVLFPGPTADAAATRIEFGDVAAGETTVYRNVPGGVYRYAAYEYTVGGRKVEQPVIDWVGESPMQGTKFTYRLEFDVNKQPGGQVQSIQVMVDEP